jgi:PKD repeat protein
MRLYVDGKVVGSRTDVTTGQAYSGYWRIGGDNLGGWPSRPSSDYLNGSIGQVAIYPSVLTRQDVVSHYVASGRTSPIAAAPSDAYGAAVYNDDPTLYWRLGESTGSAAADSGQQENPGTYAGGVTQGLTGALSGVNNSAASFGAGSGVSSNAQFNNPATYSLETWFNTTTTVGGKLIGFGNAQTGQSSSYDRHVYMQDDGTLVFGTYTGQLNTVTSGSPYNDGNWHHAVAIQSSGGMKLYVDGVLVGTNPQTGAQDYSGYWRIGGDTTWSSSSPWFNGKLDEVAVYSSALSAQDIANHYSLGSSAAPANVAPTAAFTSTVDHLSASFDGSTSADSDGTVATYAWNFGDGQTGTGATPTHVYAAAGTFTATLTVTDNKGATDTISHPITVSAANVAPTAAFTSGVSNLTASLDASASADSDGTIASYAWDFGDTQTGSGVTTSHLYAAAGTYTVSLTVTDDKGATRTITHPVTVAAANVSPTAAFTSTVSNLAASFDGSTSTDSDGTIASYAWNFGDGQTGSGATVAHSYAAAGTYTVSLTVTDNKGATDTVTHPATAVAPPANVIAQANFDTAILNSWGTADVGGAWTHAGAAAAYRVADGVGQQIVPAGSTKTSSLSGVSATSTDLRASFTTDKAPTGGGIYVSAIGRDVVSTNYQARLWLQASGAVKLQLLQGGTSLRLVSLPGITYTAGTVIQVRLQVFGTSPTTVRAKAWAGVQTEPAAWQASVSDATAALQTAGRIGLRSYLSSTATTIPVTTRFDNLSVTPQQ